MRDSRSVWLVTKAGAPLGFAWGNSAADAVGLLAGSGADGAVVTRWRRLPTELRHDFSEIELAGIVNGRTLKCGGVDWDLDDPGEDVEDRENDAPRGKVVNQAKRKAALAKLEQLRTAPPV